jgi:hypothetical protein
MNTARTTSVSAIGLAVVMLAAIGAAPAHGQDEAQPPQVTAAHAAFVAACNRAISASKSYSWNQFTQPQSVSRIRDLQAAVQAKKAMLRTGREDPIAREIGLFQHEIDSIERTTRRPPGSTLPLDEECNRTYIAFLRAVDAPALELAKKEAAQESAGVIEQQRQEREHHQAIVDAAAAERARRQKEAEIAAAQAGEEQLQRERAAIAAAHREAAKLPACADARTIEAVEEKFEVRHIAVKTFDKPTDDPDQPLGGTEQDPERLCRGHVVTSAGEGPIAYKVRWWDDRHDKILVSVQ